MSDGDFATAAPRPRHLGPEYASQFADEEVALAYGCRPPYPEEAARVVAGLMRGPRRRVLELGAGSGDFTVLLAPRVERVTAVEPAAAMRRIGERRTAGAGGRVEWRATSAEAFRPDHPHELAVAAESLHWMEWEQVLPRIADGLPPGGLLALVDRTLAEAPPWEPELRRLIARASTNRHYRPLDLIAELERRGLYRPAGELQTEPQEFRQSVRDYVESFHSRNGFSRARMAPEAAEAFDSAVEALVVPHAPGGELRLRTTATVSWGHPRRRAGVRP